MENYMMERKIVCGEKLRGKNLRRQWIGEIIKEPWQDMRKDREGRN